MFDKNEKYCLLYLIDVVEISRSLKARRRSINYASSARDFLVGGLCVWAGGAGYDKKRTFNVSLEPSGNRYVRVTRVIIKFYETTRVHPRVSRDFVERISRLLALESVLRRTRVRCGCTCRYAMSYRAGVSCCE